jgi:putative ABC transport system substrate-binding protein
VKRRDAVTALAALGAAPLASFAQQQGKVWRIGFLGVTNASGYVSELEAIRRRLGELGYTEGRNIVIEYRWAEGNPERLKKMAAELVALKVDAIITHSIPGTRTAAQATKTIPIVMADGADPVGAGLIASHARPGGNITGSTSFQPENSTKRLQLLTEVVPRLKRVAALFNALNTNNDVYLRELEPAAIQLKVELQQFAVKGIGELPSAFAAMAEKRMEAAVIGEDPVLNTSARAIAELAVKHRLPASGFTNFADAGGLLGYGANRALVYGRAANFVDKILRGAKPGDLPIEGATKFDLIVNLKTAKALGVRVPTGLLQRADRVIET